MKKTTTKRAAGEHLDRAVAGALKSTIAAHGAITPASIGGAVKRIRGALKSAAPSAADMGRRRWAGVSEAARRKHAQAAAAERWAGTTEEERAAFGRAGGRSAWAGMSKEERSAELKRRAARRKKTTPHKSAKRARKES